MSVTPQLKELLLQSLEHERGGELVYDTALDCVINDDLEERLDDFLEHTERHVEVLTEACEALGIDPDEMTPGRQIVQANCNAMIAAMKMAAAAGDPTAAELVACECVMAAEVKDHFNWELIGECARALDGDAAAVLMNAYQEVEYDEEEHVLQSRGWCRELWLDSLGLESVLPPPEDAGDADLVEQPNAESEPVSESSTAATASGRMP